MQNQQILNTLAQLINNANTSNNISLQHAFNIFIDYSKANCRKATINYYTGKFKLLNEVFNNLGLSRTNDITKVSYNNIINYLHNLGYTNATINKCMDLLKSIFKVCNDLDYISYNVISGIKKLKEIQPQIQMVKKETKIDIEQYLFTLPETPLNLRNISLFLLMNDTGARANELIEIKNKNINIENNSILLEYTKTHHTRIVYFRDITKYYLSKYLQYNNQEYLFINLDTGEQLKKNSIYDIIDKIKKTLNIDYSITPHKYRHALATELVNNNVHVNEIMKVLGHTQFSTTQRYIHQEQSKIKNDVLNVLENKKN